MTWGINCVSFAYEKYIKIDKWSSWIKAIWMQVEGKKNEGRFKLKEMFANITRFIVDCFNNDIYTMQLSQRFQITFVMYAAASMT